MCSAERVANEKTDGGTSEGRGAMTGPTSNMRALVVCAILTASTPAFAQDAARVAAGEAAWDKAGCLQCHGASGEGGAGGEFVAGPSLRTTLLDRAGLVETIRCGRSYTQMPAWLDGAYTEIPCFGSSKGP